MDGEVQGGLLSQTDIRKNVEDKTGWGVGVQRRLVGY